MQVHAFLSYQAQHVFLKTFENLVHVLCTFTHLYYFLNTFLGISSFLLFFFFSSVYHGIPGFHCTSKLTLICLSFYVSCVIDFTGGA